MNTRELTSRRIKLLPVKLSGVAVAIASGLSGKLNLMVKKQLRRNKK
jgi:hypothetical protein